MLLESNNTANLWLENMPLLVTLEKALLRLATHFAFGGLRLAVPLACRRSANSCQENDR